VSGVDARDLVSRVDVSWFLFYLSEKQQCQG